MAVIQAVGPLGQPATRDIGRIGHEDQEACLRGEAILFSDQRNN
jgi:hypothetical protein